VAEARASRLHSAILIPPKGILRVAGARPLPFAAIVGLEGGAASIRQPQYANAIIGLDGGARNIGQPEYAVFTGFPMLIDLDAAMDVRSNGEPLVSDDDPLSTGISRRLEQRLSPVDRRSGQTLKTGVNGVKPW
jgi:hypothetical protein